MTDPTPRLPLSPAAQAVKGAVLKLYGDQRAADMAWPLELPVVTAALRAAADQVVPPKQETPWGSWIQAPAAELRIRNELLALAAELEGWA